MASLRCTVATPTRELFSGEIHYASVPGAEGSYGVLPGHEMLVSSDKQGILTLWLDEAGNTRRQFLLYEGAAQVYQDTLTVLGRFGTDLDTLDVEVVKEKAEALRQQIERAIRHKPERHGALSAQLRSEAGRAMHQIGG